MVAVLILMSMVADGFAVGLSRTSNDQIFNLSADLEGRLAAQKVVPRDLSSNSVLRPWMYFPFNTYGFFSNVMTLILGLFHV